jgi:biotin operon repressor
MHGGLFMKKIITTAKLDKTLDILKNAAGFMLSIELANKLGIGGSHELKKRTVRVIIKDLRDSGHWIVASVSYGYFLTKDLNLWREYNEGRQIDAKRIIGESAKRKNLVDSRGQVMLFDSRVNCGCAVGGH